MSLQDQQLRVLLADEDSAALERLESVLRSLGHQVTPHAVSVRQAAEMIASEDPDVAIVMVHNDAEHALALIDEAVEFASGPVLAHVNDGNVATVAAAAQHGIDGWLPEVTPKAVQSALEVAMRRYRETAALAERVDQLETALDRRAVIERAKGILMERHSLDERAAFELLRDRARAGGRRVVDLARAVGDGHALLPRD